MMGTSQAGHPAAVGVAFLSAGATLATGPSWHGFEMTTACAFLKMLNMSTPRSPNEIV